MPPLTISVVIPTYNRSKCVGEAIESVLGQTHVPNEVIVVDDGSIDNTPEVLAAFGSEIQVIRKKNGGVSSARNAGVNAARSEWVAFLDSDDLWLPEKLAQHCAGIRLSPEIVAHAMDTRIENAAEAPRSLFALRGMLGEFQRHPVRTRPLQDVLKWCFFTQALIIRRDICLQADLFPQNMRIHEDSTFLGKVALRGPFRVCAEAGCVVRRVKDTEGGLTNIHRDRPVESLAATAEMFRRILEDKNLPASERPAMQHRLSSAWHDLAVLHNTQKEWKLRDQYSRSSFRTAPGVSSFVKAALLKSGCWGLVAGFTRRMRSGDQAFRRSNA